MSRVYLDNNASAPPFPGVIEATARAMRELSGNASSVHEEGRRARRVLEESRETIASFLGAASRELFFTSGGSESNNTAIRGVAFRTRERCHVVVSAIEHPSVLATAEALRAEGCEVSVVGCDASGVVDPAAVEAVIGSSTAIVAVMLANNETGVIQPVAAIAEICRRRGVHFHLDASQAAGRIPLDVAALGADSVAISAHKMHGPKGIGALFLRRGIELVPLVTGGAQERRRRAGTESVPLAAGFAAAVEALTADVAGESRMAELRDRIESGVFALLPSARVQGSGARRLPNTSSLCLPGHDAEGVVIGLDLAGVAVSTGSACSSGRIAPSHVLLAMGLSEEDARSSIRISLGRMTTSEDARQAVDAIGIVLPRNRKEPTATSVARATVGSDGSGHTR
ncbi:MAG: cysteine desulfurase family protein [Thermoanaerobaculia bacterium]|jgi:cysteine desulfurase